MPMQGPAYIIDHELIASVFPRECVIGGQYLRAAGSPKASTLPPWLISTESTDSSETEERTGLNPLC